MSIVDSYLAQIEDTKHLNIYIEVYAEEAQKKAMSLQEKYERGEQMGRLFGCVVSIKDVLVYKDHTTTAGSKMLEGFKSIYTATAIQKVLDEDAILIGRVNCDEFAMGSGNENSYYGPTINGIGENRVPGGSSGGSAVSVQMGTCTFSLGTDTGGSVRQPAAFCGMAGFKPTYGRVSRYGLIAYGSSFDQIGILSHYIDDIAKVFSVIAGSDTLDSTTSEEDVPDLSDLTASSEKYKIAYYHQAIENEGLDPEIKKDFENSIESLRIKGHTIEAIDFELLDYIVPTYYVLTTAEASSNLARYDGVRYGYRQPEANTLEETYVMTRTKGFGKEVKKRIMLGTFVLSAGYYDAYYGKAQKVRQLLIKETEKIFKSYDFILMPVSPTTAWKCGSKTDNPLEVYLSDIFTVQANLTGIPAISIPTTKHSNGMPIGVQIMSKSFSEDKLLSFAKYLI